MPSPNHFLPSERARGVNDGRGATKANPNTTGEPVWQKRRRPGVLPPGGCFPRRIQDARNRSISPRDAKLGCAPGRVTAIALAALANFTASSNTAPVARPRCRRHWYPRHGGQIFPQHWPERVGADRPNHLHAPRRLAPWRRPGWLPCRPVSSGNRPTKNRLARLGLEVNPDHEIHVDAANNKNGVVHRGAPDFNLAFVGPQRWAHHTF